MLYSLSNGKTVRISFEDWLSLTDERIQELLASDAGYYTEDPFIDLDEGYDKKKYSLPDLSIEELDPDQVKEIEDEINRDKIE